MSWAPLVRKTRSGTVFSGWLDGDRVSALRADSVDFATLLARAIAENRASDEDSDPEDDLDGLDNEPLADPTGVDNEFDNQPMNQVDRESPAPNPLNEPPRKKQKRNDVIFEDVVAAGKRPNGSHRRRNIKLTKEIQAKGQTPRPSITREQVQAAVYVPLPFFDTLSLPTTSSAYMAKAETAEETRGSKKRRSLKELLALGFRLVGWNGITPQPLVDQHGRIFGVLAGQPNKPGYRTSVCRAYEAMKEERLQAQFPAKMLRHRRGLFAAINVGLTVGPGQSSPTWVDGKEYSDVAERLLANEDINRMAVFASYCFSMWAPRLYKEYHDNNKILAECCPNFRRPFSKSVFACTAFNLASNVWTFKHRDVRNLPYGWCAVQSMGHFDPTKGGHLILWDVKLVVEFPAGACILLPSATIAHSNIPVQDGDERVSFTQFTSGALFRYCDNYRETHQQLEEDNPEGFAGLGGNGRSRWDEGLSKFSTVDEFFDN
ncbi:hypothetical protein R3P38DRAFT_2773238 [Favolaschia claudopus]|uniref:Uncharacterized protein n=1 Tax=Favolaschia claudopus TaxID=2862362 RepID=A0AAW0C0S3_9AGAR